MIELVRGDILRADVQALVNTVNCAGIMGRGIALQFRKAFPKNYEDYKKACDRNQVRPGVMLVHDLGRLTNPRFIINFPTKRHWKGKSRIKDIDAGLEALITTVRELGIHSIALPPLGCGLGGLDWQVVRPRIESALKRLPDVQVLLFEPEGPPAPEEMVIDKKAPLMTIGRAVLLGLMRRYLAAVMDPFVSLLEIHKLLYFMQESGEGLRLRYSKGIYGPYAENLKHVMSRIEGHFISGYGDTEDRPDKHIELKQGAVESGEQFLKEHPDTRQRFARVVDLIEGFETPFGMELLSSVHWVITRGKATSVDAAITEIYTWSDRKKMFNNDHIRIAWNVLHEKGWMPRTTFQ